MQSKENITEKSVTVIIPCYNAGRYLDDAIKSIVNQTFRQWQIIVVDDGSTDPKTLETLKSLSHPKTKVLFKKNGGVSSARNYGANHSVSEYILFFDADDIFEDTFLEKSVSILNENHDVGVVTCFERVFPDGDFRSTIGFSRPEGGRVEDFLAQNNALASSLVRRRCWQDAGGYDEALLSHEDWDFWIKVTKHGWTVKTIPEVLFHYRKSSQSKYQKFKHKKPELVKHIVANNKDAYREHVVECFYQKEKACAANAESTRERIKSSLEYRTGFYIVFPLRLLRRVIRKIKALRPS